MELWYYRSWDNNIITHRVHPSLRRGERAVGLLDIRRQNSWIDARFSWNILILIWTSHIPYHVHILSKKNLLFSINTHMRTYHVITCKQINSRNLFISSVSIPISPDLFFFNLLTLLLVLSPYFIPVLFVFYSDFYHSAIRHYLGNGMDTIIFELLSRSSPCSFSVSSKEKWDSELSRLTHLPV